MKKIGHIVSERCMKKRKLIYKNGIDRKTLKEL